MVGGLMWEHGKNMLTFGAIEKTDDYE